ncbi:MAG: capsule polysaccharide biosynthesis protein, partial [Chthoniobacter sp.]|nr:capsule polysaccharide biosynthesis protein [Chthoniobacter sp.]
PWESWPTVAGARKSAVLVTPWLGTSVPFFSLEIARMLAEEGEQVQVLFDATDVFGNAPSSMEIEDLREAVAGIERYVPVSRTETWASAVCAEEDLTFARQLVYENGIWRTRGEAGAGAFAARKESLLENVAKHLRRVEDFIAASGIEWLLIPGGIWGLSGIYVRAAQRAGVPFVTYDSGKKILILCQNGIAAHQADIPKALESLKADLGHDSKLSACEWARAECAERLSGRGNYNVFQAHAATGETGAECNVLVPLNLRWDSAALGRQRLFASVKDWIGALVRWAETEPLARVCIRQHPIERRAAWRSSDDLGQFIRDLQPNPQRVRFIAAEDPVNTYDLLAQTKVLLPFTSSMAMEAGMRGIPVITSAQNYYESCEFVVRAESVDDYFALIGRALRGGIELPSSAPDDAALVYYLTQRCNLMKTSFTAESVEFLEWSRVSPEVLWQEPEAQDLRRALRGGEPLSFIRHQRFASAPAAERA